MFVHILTFEIQVKFYTGWLFPVLTTDELKSYITFRSAKDTFTLTEWDKMKLVIQENIQKKYPSILQLSFVLINNLVIIDDSKNDDDDGSNIPGDEALILSKEFIKYSSKIK